MCAKPPGNEGVISRDTECFGAQEVDIFNLKGNCVLRTLKNSFTIF